MRAKLLGLMTLIAAALASGQTWAQIQGSPFLVVGAGLAPCEAWVEARRDRTAVAFEQWVLGFVSGVSAASPGIAPLFRTDGQTVAGWVDNYCLEHPRETIATAGAAFVSAHPR